MVIQHKFKVFVRYPLSPRKVSKMGSEHRKTDIYYKYRFAAKCSKIMMHGEKNVFECRMDGLAEVEFL